MSFGSVWLVVCLLASDFNPCVIVRSLVSVVGDLFQAGADTTSNTLSWMILYLTKFPHVQTKLHAELDEVVGKSRNPTLEDRPRYVSLFLKFNYLLNDFNLPSPLRNALHRSNNCRIHPHVLYHTNRGAS